jgi:hypothetical protein
MSVGYDRIARDIAFTLEVKSEKIFENIFLQNGCLAALGASGRVKVVRGGNRFDERVHLGQNSTVGHRSKFAPIPTDFQNNFETAYYGQAVCDGSAVVNLVEQDQNMGDHKIDDLAQKLVEEAQLTFPNKIGDAIMKVTPTNVDPDGIVSTLEATAYGSQTSTTGALARSSHTGVADPTDAWQNQFDSTALANLGAAAGIAALCKFLWTCSPGGSAASEQPDIGLTTTGVMAMASGGGDTLRRYAVNDKMLKLGFDNILFNRCALMADRNVAAGRLYAINSNYVRMQVLAGQNTKTVGNVQTIGEGKQSVSLQVRPPIEADNYLNYTIKMYLVYNITWGGLRQHGLKTAITEA